MGWNEIISFIVGALSGGALCYFGFIRLRAENSVKKQMTELQEEFTAYRENVNQHFSQTANLVNDLTENYIAVQKHLENAASSFAEPPKSFKLEEDDSNLALPSTKSEFTSLKAQASENFEDDADFSGDSAEPPRDYAPKNNPDEQGTLDEGFRLQDQPENPSTTS